MIQRPLLDQDVRDQVLARGRGDRRDGQLHSSALEVELCPHRGSRRSPSLIRCSSSSRCKFQLY